MGPPIANDRIYDLLSYSGERLCYRWLFEAAKSERGFHNRLFVNSIQSKVISLARTRSSRLLRTTNLRQIGYLLLDLRDSISKQHSDSPF